MVDDENNFIFIGVVGNAKGLKGQILVNYFARDIDKFKSYEDLKTRLDYVLGAKRSAPVVEEEDTSRGQVEDLGESRVPTRTAVAVVIDAAFCMSIRVSEYHEI